MVGVPWHPQIVHLPLALALLLPLVALIVMVCIRKQKFSTHVWILVAGLQVLTTASGYLAMETGEDDERAVAKLVGKAPVHEHEERAEMFVAFSVAASVLAIATIIVKPSVQLYLMLTAFVLMLGQMGLAWRTGASGGELIYVHKAANAHAGKVEEPITDEAVPVDTSEEHDYAADEVNEEDEDRENDDEKDE